MVAVDVGSLVTLLREVGNDTSGIEAKDASGGVPSSLDETLSAFGNSPEGGVLLLGVAKNDGAFDITGVSDSKTIEGTLAGKARNKIVPPLQLGAVETVGYEGKKVVVCVIPPQPSDRRPFRVGRGGPAYIRAADGDYRLDENEEQLLVNQRTPPLHERTPVEGATVERDLDEGLLHQYLEFQTKSSPRLARQSFDDQLIRTNVIDGDSGFPTLAAVYALGIHPQEFFPALAVKARVTPRSGDPSSVRLRDSSQFAGPLPDLLDQSFQWVEKQLNTTIIFSGGQGRDTPELPAVAVRETLANALVHRDLSAASMSMYVQLIKKEDRLVVTNPGGLWGLTERELGRTGPRARNPVLYDMCNAIHTAGGNRVIEASATGIPAIRQSLHDAFLPAPYFRDNVISFDAILTASSMLSDADLNWLRTLPGEEKLSTAQRHALIKMRGGTSITNRSYRDEFPMDSTQARAELQQLVEFGLASAVGQAGGTGYTLAKRHSSPRPDELLTSRDASAQNDDGVKRTGKRPYVSAEAKVDLVIATLTRSPEPLTRAEIADATGLTTGQLAPTIRKMREENLLQFTNPHWNAHDQRYSLM
ncbi:ATP-binding protein [Corynebacterium sp. UBA2622]|uniref:ATP-binding protein n=1 Tax=Corynebacterium sp. UBA2622 TaxID=1946393 RepID=UPI0025BA422A|nr:ATP-binding protein [Corynebacterium sp. UBA2622]